MKISSYLPWIVGALWIASCGDGAEVGEQPSGNTGGEGAGPSGNTGGEGAGASPGTGGGLIPIGQSCTAEGQNCPEGQICHPLQEVCVAGGPCDEHSDCGEQAYCDSEIGRCAPSATGSPCAEDENCREGESCLGGFCGCEGENYTAENVPPNMLIVLDRSSSMTSNNVPGTGGQSRWTVARAAITSLVETYGDGIRFGLALFPGTAQTCNQSGSGSNCGRGEVFIDPADDTAEDIVEFVNSSATTTCSYGTPMRAMFEYLYDYEGLEDPDRPNYVVFVADGVSQCSGQNNPGNPGPPVTELFEKDPSVRTFVIGFSGSVDADELNNLAERGGTARSDGPPYYYQADDADQLNTAFETIVGSVLSCNYALSETPQDLSQFYVYFDQERVDRDPSGDDGWDYDADTGQVIFSGNACDSLRDGAVSDLVLVYGCPPRGVIR